jgi:hypothetical protein
VPGNLAGGIRRLAFAAAACILGAVVATAGPAVVVRATDPEPPSTMLSWGGSPNIPVWQTFDLRVVQGTDPVDHFECSLDGAPWTGCTSPWDPDLTGGEHTFAARAVDVNGLADPTPEVAVLWVDTEGPVVTLAINAGATATGRYLVRLDAAFQDRTSVFHVRVSNSPELDAQGRLANAWETNVGLNAATWGWHLDDARFGGSATPGIHTVYVQGEDAFGNWNVPVSASITVDPATKPAARIRLAASENPAPVGDRVIVFALVEAVDGAPIEDGTLSLWITAPGCDGCSTFASGWPVENGVFVDASRLEPGRYPVTATYTGSADIADATASFTLQIGPALSLMGPYAFFRDPTPYPYWDTPGPFTLGIDSRFDEAVSFECRIDEAPWAPCAGQLQVPEMPAGSHTAEIRGRDRGGRVQALPEMFTWRSRVGTAAQWWIHPQTGVTRDPIVGFQFQAPSGALAVRLSNSRALDVEGRLTAAQEISPPPALGPMAAWDVTDPAYGGTPGDGRKLVWLQWQLADGSWTVPELANVVLDRAPPSITLKIEGGHPFVDEDELLVVAKATEPVEICLGETPEAVTGWSCGGTRVGDGLGLIPWPAGDVPEGTVAVRHLYAAAHDTAGNWSPVVEAWITVDRTDPVARIYPVAFVTGSRVTSSSVALRIRAAATDTGSGVRSVTVQETSGAGSSTVASAPAATVTVNRRVPFSASRSWRTRGVDRLGHIGAWATGTLVRPVSRDDRGAAVSYRGSWARVADGTALADTLRRSRAAGATASMTFTGRAVAIVAPRGPGRGKADVLVDGVRVATIDTRAYTFRPREIVFSKAWSTAGRHTVTLRVRGTTGRPTVSLDAFVFVP